MSAHRRGMALGLLLSATLLTFAGCKSPDTPGAPAQGERVDTVRATAWEVALDQGWTPANRAVWYERSQGSRLMPLSWLFALEDEAGKPLFSQANIERWGYLPHVNAKGRALPIGFTEDTTPDARLPKPLLTWRKTPTADDKVWVGMNCSACHTAQLTYKGETLTVDGGPALSDFEGFLHELRAALDATAADDRRFARFADRVLGEKPLEPWTPSTPGMNALEAVKETFTKGDNDDEANRAMLRAALRQVAAREAELKRLNASSGASDYGRLDAFGHIFNKVAMIAQPRGQKIQQPSPSDAPVSYPFLWNVPQHDRVQWNGVAPNTVTRITGRHIGALARNAGEVIGVFGDIQVGGPLQPWPSSIDRPGLVTLEQQLNTLRPPAWPEKLFGWASYSDATGKTATHEQLVADGAKLFGSPGKPGRCVACHQLLDRKDLKTPIVAQMALFNPPPGPPKNIHRSAETDIGMACNAYTKTAKGGLMAGQLIDQGRMIRTEGESIAVMLKHSVIRALLGTIQPTQDPSLTAGASEALAALASNSEVTPGPGTPEQRCLAERSPILGYKGRPLNGIWATAPYLHNGSVRTLYQLLLPPEQRETSFAVGSREFDPKDVGYVSSTAANHSTFVTGAKGNSNAGHDYGNGKLTEYDRRALIEFMKTL